MGLWFISSTRHSRGRTSHNAAAAAGPSILSGKRASCRRPRRAACWMCDVLLIAPHHLTRPPAANCCAPPARPSAVHHPGRCRARQRRRPPPISVHTSRQQCLRAVIRNQLSAFWFFSSLSACALWNLRCVAGWRIEREREPKVSGAAGQISAAEMLLSSPVKLTLCWAEMLL